MKRMLGIVLLLPSLAFSYAGGPPNGLTGGPGEGTCIQCHSGNGLNSGDGSFTISGPASYTPGQTYPITVILSDPGQSRWGFEASSLGQGEVTLTDAVNTQSASQSGRVYVKHTSTGTHDNTADGPVSWSLDWTAPESESEVIFYAAGNAANSNNNSLGDFIYTTSLAIPREVSVAPAPRPDGFALLGAAPNPFNPSTEISFQMDQGGLVRLTVFDLAGREVARLMDGTRPAGRHSARWNGLTAQGRPVATGVYLARLEHRGRAQVTRLLLVK